MVQSLEKRLNMTHQMTQIVHPWVFQRNENLYSQKDMYEVFIAALLKIAKHQKQPSIL
jgi:hypothetical protein